MKDIQDLAKIEPKAQELMVAAGYFNIASLEGCSLDEITDEMIKANQILKVLKVDPTPELVKQWLEPLKDEIRGFDALTESENESDTVTNKELLSASFAIPLSKAFIEKNDIELNQLISGRVRFLEKNTPKIEETEELVTTVSQSELVQHEEFSEPEVTELEEAPVKNSHVIKKAVQDDLYDGKVHIDKRDARIDKKNILTIDTYRKEGSIVSPLQSISSNNLVRSTRKETNEGVNSNSKRFIRGVLNKRAGSFRLSLFAYLTFVLFTVCGFTLPLLAVLDKEKFYWAIFSPSLVIVGVFIYLIFAGKASCPVCNQKQFRPKNCLKHRDAHRIPLLGYMLPTALHALIFHWFKCIFCGTSVRLKE